MKYLLFLVKMQRLILVCFDFVFTSIGTQHGMPLLIFIVHTVRDNYQVEAQFATA